jgi:hypothetical protein
MNITPRYLTKSRFKLALECPTKLYYTAKSKEYKNTRNDDPFLAALADGGFQVEELARLAYPEGVLIQAASGAYDEAVAETEALLKLENCVIFEAAFRYENLFIRTDILVKKGNVIELIEVKAKSFLLSDWLAGPFLGKRGGIETSWKPYLFDIAFQTYVLQNACPQFEVRPFMQLIDKSKKAQVNNLNQCFRISKNGDKRKDTIRLVNSLAEIGGENLMTQIDVSGIVFGILSGRYFYNTELTRNFEDLVQDFSQAYETDQKINAPVQFTACKSCEFKNFDTDGLKSGFHECWKEKMNWGINEFSKPSLLEVWNFKKGGALLRDHQVVLMEELTKEMHPLSLDPHKITSSERQWLQIEKALANDDSIYVDRENLKAEIQEWEFPLHFIDFETSTVAIPFNTNRRPYEQVSFQFSHHIVEANGAIIHANEYINTQPGEFPNFEFVRALKLALGGSGTIFRYSNHENTVLNQIRVQLLESDEVDKQELVHFIESITKRKDDEHEGERCMVDLCEVYKNYYFDPHTKGSNSIKAVLPAMLRRSMHLQEKYAQPLADINVTSKNFSQSHTWLQVLNDEVKDPYKMLPPVFEQWTNEELDQLSDIEDLNNGGAALTAYGFMQYTDMSDQEREALSQALKKYCELDTLAMVMIWEGFREVCGVVYR